MPSPHKPSSGQSSLRSQHDNRPGAASVPLAGVRVECETVKCSPRVAKGTHVDRPELVARYARRHVRLGVEVTSAVGARRLIPMTDVLNVSTAAPTHEAALRLAQSAIAAGLAAGGQVAGPVTSVFWHNGEMGRGEEWVVSFKTPVERYDELEAHLIERHEWQNPEVTAVPLARASAAYVEWVERVTAKKVADDG